MSQSHPLSIARNYLKANVRFHPSAKARGFPATEVYNTSGFKGVHKHKQTGRWQARIVRNGKRHSLGLFDTIEAAALAYDKAAIEFYGKFAVLNLPNHLMGSTALVMG